MSDQRYEFLARLKPNSWSLACNDHACNYCTAAEWIERIGPADMFDDVPPELLEGMKRANSIYSLQVYTDTPIGSYMWFGPTMDSVIEQAMASGVLGHVLGEGDG